MVNGVRIPLIAFREVDLAFGDHLVLGKLSFEIAARRDRLRRRPVRLRQDDGAAGRRRADRADRGEVAFAGAPIRGPRRDVAIVFQDYSKALLPWRTAAGNVSLALGGDGNAPRASAPTRIARLLERVGLPRPRRQISRRKCRAACSSACRSRAASRRSPPR